MDRNRKAAALNFAIAAIRDFQGNPKHGPVSDVIGMAVGLRNKTFVDEDGRERKYFSFSSEKGDELILLAATKNYQAYILAKRIVASRIASQRPLSLLLREFASSVLIDAFPTPKSKTGPKVHEKWHQGVFIYFLAKNLSRRFGLNPIGNTRKEETNSAMSLIPEAARKAGNPEFTVVTPNSVRGWVLRDSIMKDLEATAEDLGPWFQTYEPVIDIDDIQF